MKRSKFCSDEIEFIPCEDLHLAAFGRRVRHNRGRVLLDVLAANAVPENLPKRAVNVMGRSNRELLSPGADRGRAQTVDPSLTERRDSVVQSVTQRLERDVFGDVLSQI